MRLRSVAVLGGGPGGLYAARLLKLRDPACRVVVHEQGAAGETFGFGVGLATRTQRNLDAADPASLADIVAASWEHDMSMSVDGRRVRLPYGNLLAIARSTLLEVLTRHAAVAGVELHHGSRLTVHDLDADLVIAADGVNSATRETYADELGARIDTDGDYYLWCGTELALPSAVFSPARTEAGTFVTHAYPYAANRSTYLVETDALTWRRAGFDATTAATPPDASDEQALAYLADAFSEELHGHRLIGNRTRWTQFRTVTCERWHVGSTVLLGDAAHTAHYSIGSGTKLAMEDAIALDRVLAGADDLPSALAAYEAERRPSVERLQETARRSMRWWHSFPQRLDLPVEQLFISYMTRAGKVTLERFAQTAPEVVDAGLAAYAGNAPGPGSHDDLAAWVVEHAPGAGASTAEAHEVVVDLDDPWGPAGDALVAKVGALVGDPTTAVVVVTAADDEAAVLTMLETGERLRRDLGCTVVARASDRFLDHLVAALASGRVDRIDPVHHEEVA